MRSYKISKASLLLLTAVILISLSPSPLLGGNNQERFPVRIEVKNRAEIGEFIRVGIDITNVKGNWIEAYVTQDEFKLIKNRDFDIVQIPDYAKLMADSLWEITKDSRNPMGAYHTYEELTVELASIATDHPDICHLESIGESVQGRELWFMEISDNVSQEEDEPEFKYISTMHGNEPVGTEMLIYLINYLVDNYGTDSLVTYLVDNTEIWIMPLMNPDGNAAGSRYNANGEDLNRDFPDPITDSTNTPEGREPETQAVMNFCFGHSFVSSANFHTGALVVNYPWDSAIDPLPHYEATPDDPLFIYISEAYSIHNEPMWNGSFYHGITNGAAWYVIYGGMQDWNYNWLACNEVTIELSNTKWPDPSTLPGFWDDNREAMLAYMEQCHRGIRGLVTDVSTGQSLAATVNVLEIGKPVYTDPDVGDYHRMLLPGIYTVQFTAKRYLSQTFDSVEVVADSATRLNVQLQHPPMGNISGLVTDSISDQPLYALVEVFDSGFEPVNTDSLTGHYSIDVYQGIYAMKVVSNGYRTVIRDSIMVTDTITEDFQLEPLPVDSTAPEAVGNLTIRHIDDSSATLIWTAPGDDGTSGRASLYDLRYSLTSVGTDTVGWWDTAVTVPGESSPSPSGMTDSCIIKNLFPDTTYYFVIRTADEVPNWSGFSNVAIGETRDGAVSDSTDLAGLPQCFELFQNYPNPFNPVTQIRYASPRDGQVHLSVYNVLGKKVRNLVNTSQKAGYYMVSWDGRDDLGKGVTTGIYFYLLQTNDYLEVKKMVLLR